MNSTFELGGSDCAHAQKAWASEREHALRLQRKVQEGLPISAIAIGGSVTCGMNYNKAIGDHDSTGAAWCKGKCSNKAQAWPAWLTLALHGCGLNITVSNNCMRAVGSRYWANRIAANTVVGLQDADIVLVETSTNDWQGILLDLSGPVSTWKPSIANHRKDPQGGAITAWVEILVTLLLRLPKRPFVLFVHSMNVQDYNDGRRGAQTVCNLTDARRVGDQWWRSSKTTNTLPTFTNEAYSRVLSHYAVGSASMFDIFAPADNDPVLHDFFSRGYFFGDCMHPSVLGHRMIASVVGYRLLSLLREDRGSSRTEFMARSRAYRNPVALTLEAKNFLERHADKSPPPKLLDFTQACAAIVETEGFALREDVPGKPGLLGDSPGSRVLIALPSGARRLYLGAMHSYAHNGAMRVVVLGLQHPAGSGMARCDIGPATKGRSTLAWLTQQSPPAATLLERRVDTRWGLRYSVHEATELEWTADAHASCLFLSVTIENAMEASGLAPRKENKVKLLDAVAYF